MFLSIYVYRHLGLTLDLTEERLPFPRDAMQEGPAFTRLTAEPGNLRDPVRLGHWLDAFLPENGAVAPYRQHARQAWEQHGAGVDRATAASILWGNADAEYTGAIDFRRTDRHPPERLPEHGPPDLEPLSEAAIGARLELASRIVDSAPRTRPAELLALSGRRSSLSGMRGKLSLTPLADGRWGVARGDGLNTWICKHEQRLNLPGEAGVEAVCQRALILARIPAATILARVFDGRQAVLSRRTDRTVAPDGRVTARHQEEWVQAEGHPPDDKYHGGRRDEPQWPDAYRLLRQRGTRPDHAQGSLSRALVAAWLLAHSDLHRRNLGFLHAPDDAPAGIEPAPLYDVSSAVGTKYAKQLAIPVHDALDVHRIGPVQWIRHSERCGAAPDVTLAAIEELLRTLPDAVATARAHSRTRDELLEPGAAAERTAQVIQHIQARGRAWRNEANRMAKRNTPGFEPDSQRLADSLRAAADADPGGSVTCTADAAGNALHMAWTPPDGEPAAVGTAASAREAAAIAARAGVANPEDIPELERSLEAERQLTRTPDR